MNWSPNPAITPRVCGEIGILTEGLGPFFWGNKKKRGRSKRGKGNFLSTIRRRRQGAYDSLQWSRTPFNMYTWKICKQGECSRWYQSPSTTTVLYNTVNPFLIAIVNRLFTVTNSGLLQQNYMQATHQYQ